MFFIYLYILYEIILFIIFTFFSSCQLNFLLRMLSLLYYFALFFIDAVSWNESTYR